MRRDERTTANDERASRRRLGTTGAGTSPTTSFTMASRHDASRGSTAGTWRDVFSGRALAIELDHAGLAARHGSERPVAWASCAVDGRLFWRGGVRERRREEAWAARQRRKLRLDRDFIEGGEESRGALGVG